MGAMLQTFYWDCPHAEKKEFQWWNTIREQIPSLAKVGFTALWLPPVHKAANLAGHADRLAIDRLSQSLRGCSPLDRHFASSNSQNHQQIPGGLT